MAAVSVRKRRREISREERGAADSSTDPSASLAETYRRSARTAAAISRANERKAALRAIGQDPS
ncbi:hypothetical protein YTPLAS72_02660 [Nitrospira sp.]|nr:hypothetical protein YTPLAS72_02660 [Nitrospira sp.]